MLGAHFSDLSACQLRFLVTGTAPLVGVVSGDGLVLHEGRSAEGPASFVDAAGGRG